MQPISVSRLKAVEKQVGIVMETINGDLPIRDLECRWKITDADSLFDRKTDIIMSLLIGRGQIETISEIKPVQTTV